MAATRPSNPIFCRWCGCANGEAARFCGRCGASLSQTFDCPACGASNPASHRYCDACGARLVTGSHGLPSPVAHWRERATNALAPMMASPWWYKGLPLAGLALAAVAQLIFVTADRQPIAPVPGIVLLALGAALFAAGMSAPCPYSGQSRLPDGPAQAPRLRLDGWRVVGAGIGLIAFLFLAVRLLQGSRSGWDLAPWAVALIGLFMPLMGRATVPSMRGVARYAPDIAVAAALMSFFIGLNSHDVTHWYYSAIGDEYAFYLAARAVLEDGISRPFDQAGVYGNHPVLNTVYQALVMAAAGRDNFGWRFASVLSVAVTIPGIYLIGRVLADRAVAIIAATLFALSHYLFAYAHTGYNNIHPIAPTVWAIALFALGLRRNSAALLYAAGVVAGLGFYTHFAARATMPILGLTVAAHAGWRRRILSLWPLALGFVASVAPILLVSRTDVIARMLTQVPGGYSEGITGPPLQRIAVNTARNLLAFNYNPDIFHYVSGPLLDPITAVLAALGIALALARLVEGRYKLLFFWSLVAIMATGVLSPYPGVPISRLNYVVPPLVLLAAFAARCAWRVAPWPQARLSKATAGIVLAGVLGALALALNVRQFWYDTPRVFHMTQGAVAIGATRSELCARDPGRSIIVSREVEPVLRPALGSYHPGGGAPRLVNQRQAAASGALDMGQAVCVVFTYPSDAEARALVEGLKQSYPQGQLAQFTDRAGKGRVAVFSLARS